MAEVVETARMKKRSWRMRWSLRVFFFLISVVAVGIGWVSYHMRTGYLHEDVAAKIADSRAIVYWKLTRTVVFDAQDSAGNTIFLFGAGTAKVKAAPDWMQTLGVEPVFQRIIGVNINGASPEQLAYCLQQIKRLDEVGELHIKDSPLSATQLRELLEEVETKTLDVRATSIEDDPLPFLRDTNLTYLHLGDAAVSGKVIKDLPETLISLNLTGTQVTDEGLEGLVRLKNLKFLTLSNTPTSEEAIEALREKMPLCKIYWQSETKP